MAQLKLQEYFLCAMKTKITILFNNYSPLGYCLRHFGEYHNAYACFSLSVNNADYAKYVHACTFPRNVHNTDYIGYSPKHVKCFKFNIFIYYLFQPYLNYWKQNWIFLENCLGFFKYMFYFLFICMDILQTFTNNCYWYFTFTKKTWRDVTVKRGAWNMVL